MQSTLFSKRYIFDTSKVSTKAMHTFCTPHIRCHVFVSREDDVHYGGDLLPCSHRPEPRLASHGALWSYLVSLLASFACFIPFPWLPPSRTPPSSHFHLPSRARIASYTHGARAHVSNTQNSDACVQQNTISSRTTPTTKTTKHSKVHSLIMARKSLDSHSIPAR